MLLATSLDIGSCWIGAFEEQNLKNILHIPDKLKLIVLITFGYEIGKASVSPRLPLSTIVKHETYDGMNEPDIITKSRYSGPFSVLGKLLRVLFRQALNYFITSTSATLSRTSSGILSIPTASISSSVILKMSISASFLDSLY